MEYNGFQWTTPYQLNTNHFMKMNSVDESQHGERLSPDRFLSSIFEDPGRREVHLEKSSNIHLSSRLPSWLGNVIAITLGTRRFNQPGDIRRWESRAILSTFLHVATLLSGLGFGASGLYFNVYDTLSTFTKTTVLASLSRCVIGLYWIMLGVYSHSLAAKLIGNPRVVDCIRLHSKTFMKVNMVIIIALILTSVLCLNFYTNSHMLESHTQSTNHTSSVYKTNCDNIGVNIVLCKFYFACKVIFSVFSLIWNLMVAAICLSICRTLTIGIRRFIRELNFDAHIYEEFQMVQSHGQHFYSAPRRAGVSSNVKDFDDSWTIWDDDIKAFDDDTVFQLPSSRENILKDLRTLRRRMSGQDSLVEVSVNSRSEHNTRSSVDYQERHRERERKRVISCSSIPESGSCPELILEEEDQDMHQEKSQTPRESESLNQPPIISNQDLMFTYFKLMRRLSSTSRLLQRWMSSWITFVLLWSITLIIYLVSHIAQLTDLLQFLLPVVGIGLMTSAYAEVNFEGARVLKCLLPTEGRLPVIYYIQNTGLEIKIFSFVMTYNVMVTVLAGVAVTIASRIIIEQLS